MGVSNGALYVLKIGFDERTYMGSSVGFTEGYEYVNIYGSLSVISWEYNL